MEMGKPEVQTKVLCDAKIKAWDAQASMRSPSPEDDRDEVSTQFPLHDECISCLQGLDT